MGDFFLDDAFFDHPKALHVGEDAANLYVRGLAWAHRHNTGHIPKNAVHTFTARKNGPALAKRLCETAPGFDSPLWHDREATYEIHDWYVRNAKSIAKREQSRTAAKQRWRQHRQQSERNADAYADASNQHAPPQCETDATAMPYQPRTQGTNVKDPRRQQTAANGATPNPDDDDGTAALKILAERDLTRRETEKGPVANREAWLKTAIAARRQQHADTITDALKRFTWRPEQLADWLDPPPKPKPDPPQADRRDYDQQRADCDTCNGSGWTTNQDGAFIKCDHQLAHERTAEVAT